MLRPRNAQRFYLRNEETSMSRISLPPIRSIHTSMHVWEGNNDHKSQQTDEVNVFVIKSLRIVKLESEIIMKDVREVRQSRNESKGKGPFYMKRRIIRSNRNYLPKQIESVKMRNYQLK